MDICNHFKDKEIEQANKIAEVEKELSLLKNGLDKIRSHQTKVESILVKRYLTLESTPLDRNLSVTIEDARAN
jgi:hypothetical protein